MRIGIDISQGVFPGTGAQTYIVNLVKNLLQSDQTNEYVLFGSSLRLRLRLEEIAQALPKKIEAHFAPIPPTVLNILWNDLHFLPIEQFTGKLDIFHASDATQPPSKAKKVTTVHDLVCYHFPETLATRQVAIQKKRLAWVKKEADMIIAVSESTKKDLITVLGIAPDKITVIYEGVEATFTSDNRNDTAKLQYVVQKYNLPPKFLLYVGALQPRKNLARLLEAYHAVATDVPLFIAGKIGWGEALPQTKNVTILGFVDSVDLPYLYALAYGFLYPAIYEGFGLPVVEAMATGTPVLTSNTSSLPEVGGDAAIYVDPHDVLSISQGIKQLLDLTVQDYQTMQQKSLLQAKRFTWERCALQTMAVYQQLKENV